MCAGISVEVGRKPPSRGAVRWWHHIGTWSLHKVPSGGGVHYSRQGYQVRTCREGGRLHFLPVETGIAEARTELEHALPRAPTVDIQELLGRLKHPKIRACRAEHKITGEKHDGEAR